MPLRDFYGRGPQGDLVLLRDYEGPLPTNNFRVRLGDRVVSSNEKLLGSIRDVPGQVGDAWDVLRNPQQRSLMLRGLIREEHLNDRRRSALFTLVLLTMVILWGSVSLILLLANRSALGTYQSGWGLFLYSLGTSLFLPTPFEFLLASSRDQLGLVATVLIASLAKAMGAYMVLLVGDRASSQLDNLLEGKGIGARVFRMLKALAQRFGYAFIFLMFAIPFNSDTAPLFLFSVMRLDKGKAVLTIFAAIVLRSLVYLLLWDLFF